MPSIWLGVKLDAEQIIEKHRKNIQRNWLIWVNGPAYGKCVSTQTSFILLFVGENPNSFLNQELHKIIFELSRTKYL